MKIIGIIYQLLVKIYEKYVKSQLQKHILGSCGKHVIFRYNRWGNHYSRIFLDDCTQLVDFTFISNGGKLIIKNILEQLKVLQSLRIFIHVKLVLIYGTQWNMRIIQLLRKM